MSLRQRGQRPSESTNEGGGGAYGASGYGSSPSAASAGGGGGYDGYGASPPSAGSGGVVNQYGGGGGYYGGQQQQRPSPPSSYGTPHNHHQQQQPPAASGYPSAYGGAGYNTPAAAAVASSPYAAGSNNNMSSAAAGYHTAPPAYSNAGGGVYGAMGGGGSQQMGSQRAINFDSYGGSGGGGGGSPNTANPFQHNKKKSFTAPSFNPLAFITKGNNILPLLLGLTICTLLATTLHFRSSTLRIQTQIELSKQTLENHQQRTAQRITTNRENSSAEKSRLLEANARITSQISSLTTKYTEMSTRHTTLQDALNEREREKQNILKKIDHTRYALEDATRDSEKYKSMVDGKGEVEAYMKKRERALWDVVERLETKIGRESWREAEEWFGPGPHKVEMLLEYPKVNPADPPDKWPRIRNKLIIELAPLDLMPHSVNLFIQQVHHGLWDGNELITNPGHIMTFGYHRVEAHEGFVDKALENVSYQEYSTKYPHVQWTLGYMGRPGGPDFYINMRDNSIAHGPGGQADNYDLHNEADPCFGKVVEGFDMLNDISTIPVDKDHGNEIQYPVVIIRASVLVQHHRRDDSFGGGGGGDRGGGGRDGGEWEEVAHGHKYEEGEDEIMPLQTDEIPRAQGRN